MKLCVLCDNVLFYIFTMPIVMPGELFFTRLFHITKHLTSLASRVALEAVLLLLSLLFLAISLFLVFAVRLALVMLVSTVFVILPVASSRVLALSFG